MLCNYFSLYGDVFLVSPMPVNMIRCNIQNTSKICMKKVATFKLKVGNLTNINAVFSALFTNRRKWQTNIATGKNLLTTFLQNLINHRCDSCLPVRSGNANNLSFTKKVGKVKLAYNRCPRQCKMRNYFIAKYFYARA